MQSSFVRARHRGNFLHLAFEVRHVVAGDADQLPALRTCGVQKVEFIARSVMCASSVREIPRWVP